MLPNNKLMTKKQRYQGFTLAEMAIVVLIMSIAMTMGVQLLNAQLTNSAYSATKTKQETIKQALISFLRSNGRLPCPDTAATPTGFEPAGCATPALGYGVLPWATLGLSRETALDGWSNFFTYRVSDINPAPAAPPAPAVPRAQNFNQNWTLKTALGFDINSLNSPTSGGNLSLQIDQRASAGVLATIAYNAVAVIYSHGKNGFGARTVKGTTIAAPAPATDEAINNTAGTTQFIIRDITDNGAATGGAYDDVVMYLTPADLLQPLINEKTMKVCKAYCSGTCPGTNTCSASGVPIGNPSPTCACISGETLP